MKQLYFGLLAIAFFSACAFAQTEQRNPDNPGMTVSRIAICETVEDREPVGVDSVFVGVEKLCCFTEIKDAGDPTYIYHVWYFGENELARVMLGVQGVRWRTYSRKNILPQWTGDWRVEVLDAEENRISRITFKVE